MAKRRFARVDVSRTIKSLTKTEVEVNRANETLQMELAEAGKDKMQELIDKRGTGSGQWGYKRKNTFYPTYLPGKVDPPSGNLKDSGGPSRVNTGRMRNSIRVRFEGRGSVKRAAFGWINPPADDEKYFEAQEYGFTAGGFRPDKEVEGVFALRDARLYVVNEVLPRLIRKIEKRLARGVYK